MKANINAIVQRKDGSTLVLDFPRSIYDLYEKLQSVGIRQSPHRIPLSDEDGNDVRVKLYAESELGKHLLLTLSERNTLADANLLAFIVDNAREEIRPALEQGILRDQYGSMQEAVDAAKQMLYDSGPVKAVFYCPLVGTLLEKDEDGDEYESPVDGRFLHGYEWDISEALESDQASDESDMAEYSPLAQIVERTTLYWNSFLARGRAVPPALASVCEDVAVMIKSQQGIDGAVIAGYPFHLAYIRDQYGVARGLLKMGFYAEAEAILEYYWQVWSQYGVLHNAQSVGEHGIFHIHENDKVEITGYLAIFPFDLYQASGNKELLLRVMPMIEF